MMNQEEEADQQQQQPEVGRSAAGPTFTIGGDDLIPSPPENEEPAILYHRSEQTSRSMPIRFNYTMPARLPSGRSLSSFTSRTPVMYDSRGREMSWSEFLLVSETEYYRELRAQESQASSSPQEQNTANAQHPTNNQEPTFTKKLMRNCGFTLVTLSMAIAVGCLTSLYSTRYLLQVESNWETISRHTSYFLQVWIIEAMVLFVLAGCLIFLGKHIATYRMRRRQRAYERLDGANGQARRPMQSIREVDSY